MKIKRFWKYTIALMLLIMSVGDSAIASCKQCSCATTLPVCAANASQPACPTCTGICCQPAVDTCDTITRFCMPTTGLVNQCSQTFFRPRSIIEDVVFTLAQNNYFNYYLQKPERLTGFTLAFTPFVQRSTHSEKLARFFLPCSTLTCQSNALLIAQDGTGNIDPLWLELGTQITSANFKSSIAFCPRRSVSGLVVNYHQNLGFCLPCLWLDVNFALMRAEHNLHATETPLSSLTSTTSAQTGLDLFNNRAFNAGRLCLNKVSQFGVDDLEIKLGYNLFWLANSHFAFYGSILVPISPRAKNSCLFDPVIGRRHIALGFGLNAGQLFWCCCQHSLTYLFEIDYRFFLASKERRSFDLTNGDWSRYMAVAFSDNPHCPKPGINFLTQPLRVTPRSMLNVWLALHHEYCTIQTEIGYNFWLKERERVCLSACAQFPNNLGIFDLSGEAVGNTVSASGANISQAITGGNKAVSDAVFTPITRCLFNLESAAQGLALTHKLYGTIGFDQCLLSYPVLLSIGASYEFSQKNTALDQWAFWFKANVGF